LKLNYSGFIGGILAFISLVLPWWAMSISSSGQGMNLSDQVTLYLYQTRVTITGISLSASTNLPWYCSVALAFVVLSGLLGLAGSVIANGRRIVLSLGGILALFSIIIFAAGLQSQISNGSLATGYPTGAGLFSSGSYGYFGMSMDYSSYLSFGFWLALVAAIMMFAALTRERVPKPAEAIIPPQPSPPPPT
jgi:hypothetical protein